MVWIGQRIGNRATKLARGLYERIGGWTFILGGAVLAIIVDSLVSNSVEVTEPESNAVLAILELIALMLPAVAIVLQVAIQYSNKHAIEALGAGNEIRQAVFSAAVFVFASLAFAVIILLEYLSLPSTLEYAMSAVAIAMAVLFAIPAILAYVSYLDNVQSLEQTLSSSEAYQAVNHLEGLSREEIEPIVNLLEYDETEEELEELLDEIDNDNEEDTEGVSEPEEAENTPESK